MGMVKETLVDLLRKDGHDTISACEIAARAIREFLESGEKRSRLHGRTFSITLERKP